MHKRRTIYYVVFIFLFSYTFLSIQSAWGVFRFSPTGLYCGLMKHPDDGMCCGGSAPNGISFCGLGTTYPSYVQNYDIPNYRITYLYNMLFYHFNELAP